MQLLRILTYPHKVLRQICVEVPLDKIAESRDLIREMGRSMVAFDGVAIAAPQVGVPIRVIIVNLAKQDAIPVPLAMINPVILSLDGDPVTEDEGCLSFPGVRVPVARAPRVAVSFVGEDGEAVERQEFEGLLARAVQHEEEHLRGVLLLDHITSRMRRDMVERKMRKAAKRGGPRPKRLPAGSAQ